MAEDAVDKAIEVFKLKPGKVARVPDISGFGIFDEAAILDGSCQTHRVRLIGAHGYSKTLFINLIQHFGLDADVAKHLAQSYGDRAWDVAALESPATNSTNYPFRGRKLSPIYPFIDGEVRYSVRSEYAQTAVDVLARRMRLSFLNVQAALEALPAVIDLMGEELQWNQTRKDLEWTETVHFLASMGLPESKLNVTREQVLSGQTTALSEEPYPRQSKLSRDDQELKLTALKSVATPSRSTPEIRPEENIGLEPESPANIYP
jgi:glycerol-3-phosphate dehydrogenase